MQILRPLSNRSAARKLIGLRTEPILYTLCMVCLAPALRIAKAYCNFYCLYFIRPTIGCLLMSLFVPQITDRDGLRGCGVQLGPHVYSQSLQNDRDRPVSKVYYGLAL